MFRSLLAAGLLGVLLLSSCASVPPPKTRAYAHVEASTVLTEAEQILLSQGFQLEARDYPAGFITASSPVQTREILWLLPWEQERWVVTLRVKAEDGGPVRLYTETEAQQRPVLSDGPWVQRSYWFADRPELALMVRMLDDRLARLGAVLE